MTGPAHYCHSDEGGILSSKEVPSCAPIRSRYHLGMITDAEILAMMRAAFADVERPEHFTNHEHCDECFEHDVLLRSRDIDTLSRDDVGDGAWDPITMSSNQGFAHYIPALARLGLMDQ